MLALWLMGIPSAIVSDDSARAGGPAPALRLTDSVVGPATMPVDESWFASDPRSSPDYTRLLGLVGFADPAKPARLMYSSGTTGTAKCVAFSSQTLERRLLENTIIYAGHNAGRGATLNLMGLSTISGNQNALRTLLSGGLLCLPQGLPAAIDMIRMYGVQYLLGSAGHIGGLLRLLVGREPLNSVRNVYITGARIPPDILREAQAKFSADIYNGYGSTEAGTMAVGTAQLLLSNPSATGYCIPGVQMQIVDVAGNPLASDAEGRLRVRTDNLASYLGTDGELVPVGEGGWFYPGDTGRLGRDGLLHISGRVAEMINRGGVITAPEVIEEPFRRDPRLRDVAALGVATGSGFEEIWIAIVANERIDTSALLQQSRAVLRERSPDRIFQVQVIPRNENAKVQRGVLRQQLQAIVRATVRTG
jgi:acyl-coenzyme A synthetase/AMP-(fatty) acid ligase